MNLTEEALLYAAIMHQGEKRKGTQVPYILHPTEVAMIISTMTEEEEVIAAGILHDVVEDTDGTLEEIEKRFGKRVADLVGTDTEIRHPSDTWEDRKGRSIRNMQSKKDKAVKMIWLGDKLSNIRAIHRQFEEHGSDVWNLFHQKNPQMHRWYYQTIAEALEMDLNRTDAFREFIYHINAIWPGTFGNEKYTRRKYKDISLDGCQLIGKGAKSTVYRYDDELIVKVYNDKNMFKDIERENTLARRALIAGIPTAISFGIVSIGDRYGSLFELIHSDSVSNLIAKDPGNADFYAELMAELAREIHSIDGTGMDLPEYMPVVRQWISGGIASIDPELTEQVTDLVSKIPEVTTLIHGDFHTGNVMKQGEEYLLIDMERLSICHPIIELSGVYLFYVALGELDPSVIESYMNFSYEVSVRFFDHFLECYLRTDDADRIRSVRNTAALIAYVRMIRKYFKKGTGLCDREKEECRYYTDKIRTLLKMPLSFL